MKTSAFDTPITEMQETYHTLYLYFDLSEEAKDNAFSKYDNEDDARWYLDVEFDEIRSARKWFEEKTGTDFISFFDYSEHWYESGSDIYNGWGVIREFGEIDGWGMCYEWDAQEAWNKHAGRFAYLYKKLESESPAARWEWYEDAYQKELASAISDVCDALNTAWDDAKEWTYTREFFESESLDRSDDEHWFTIDGKREYIRSSIVACGDLENVDEPDNYVECIFENRSPMRLYVREYIDC